MSLVRVINQHFHDDVLGIGRDVGDEFGNTYKFLCLKVKFHVCGMFLEMI
jgi:hypothetical protein